jgi:hypothetical protein
MMEVKFLFFLANKKQENMLLKEQMTAILSQNALLKRAVAIQHERQKEYDERSNEVQGLKQLVLQYQEQLRTLEVTDPGLRFCKLATFCCLI